jgi:hypothetical protein
MANPGTALDTGVMPRCLKLGYRLCWSGRGLSIRCFKFECGGVCCECRTGREASGEAARQWHPAAAVRQYLPPVEPAAASACSRWFWAHERVRKQRPVFFTGLNAVLAARLNGGCACRSLREVASASNWSPERIREVIWQRSDNWHYQSI